MLTGFLVLGMAGCGGGGQEQAATSTPTPTATAEKTPVPADLQIRAATKAYYKALAAKDYDGVCETLARSEQRYFDRLAGACPKVYARLKVSPKQRKLMRTFQASEVEVRGDRATITVEDSLYGTEAGKLYALREGERWGISRRAPGAG
jgi:hypothetical protein